MSWLDKVNNQLTITCGDGAEYTPSYVNPKKSFDFNVAEFNFPNVDGTLVKRQAVKGRRYPIELYFQGADHLDVIARFEESAKNVNPWKVDHPYYNVLTVHPVSIEIDNSADNVSKVSGLLIETIDLLKPNSTMSPIDTVKELKSEVDEALASAYANNVTPTPTDVSSLQIQNADFYADASTIASDLNDEGSNYFQAFSQASAAIATATAYPSRAMTRIQSMVSAPSLFVASVSEQMNALEEQFTRLVGTLSLLTTPNQKRNFQASGGTLMTTMCQSSVLGEYTTVNDALIVIDQVSNNYNTYISSLDQLQTATGGLTTSYIPDPEPLIEMNNLMNFTLSELFNIAVSAQQERSIVLNYDSNAITLTHRFYGLDDVDENLEYFVQTNHLPFMSYLVIRSGTTVFYYI